ncbi:MAG: LemA-like protein [Parcubacteria group bacterium GW2011_GWB1_46_8]|nr:MAG: LemA-like protein [Parcubacteria group bacterium GW2011_GWF1_45_5]KKU45972.1 MAG: LemA-like protein [Parcubacteria group bacterium GW2011_GWB1_46_8]
MLNVILLVLVALIIFVIAIYNKLIRMRIRVDEAWADIEVQLKRRYDLVPNLVEVVKGYAKHESSVFENVTKARNLAMQGGNMNVRAEVENQFSGALKSLFAVAENYPDLKANQSFVELQRELVDTEDKVQASRRFYNGMVRDYNIGIAVFPSNILAGMFRFTVRELFETKNEAEREPVKVSF